MIAQLLTHQATKGACALTVHDAHLGQMGHGGLVEILVQLQQGLFGTPAPEVETHGRWR